MFEKCLRNARKVFYGKRFIIDRIVKLQLL